MAARYKYRFLKAGTYTRKDGSTISVHTPGASEFGGYQAFKSHKDIEVTKLQDAAEDLDETKGESDG